MPYINHVIIFNFTWALLLKKSLLIPVSFWKLPGYSLIQLILHSQSRPEDGKHFANDEN